MDRAAIHMTNRDIPRTEIITYNYVRYFKICVYGKLLHREEIHFRVDEREVKIRENLLYHQIKEIHIEKERVIEGNGKVSR